jgi:probable O-glycosylation ligase (exosortase A-associated)
MFAIITILGYFISLKEKPEFKSTALFWLVIMFFVHCFIGVVINDRVFQWVRMEDFLKTIIFFIFCVLMLRKKNHFEGIIAFLSISLCYFGLMEGLKYISTGGAHNITGMTGPLGDNNKAALGLNMCIPLMVYIVSQAHTKYIKGFYTAVLVVIFIAVLGTGSRGGMLALLFLSGYYWWTTGKKIGPLLFLILIGFVAWIVMPEDWRNRMLSINEASSDESFRSRLFFWKVNFLVALDNPFFGVGFDATSGRWIWELYIDAVNSSGDGFLPKKGFVAHSIYFQVLGNQGLFGFGIFMTVIASAFMALSQVIKYFPKNSWEVSLAKSIRVSFIAFCIGGAALNAVYFELLYLLFAMTICLKINLLIAKKENNNNYRQKNYGI